jgi:hypothetical protein
MEGCVGVLVLAKNDDVGVVDVPPSLPPSLVPSFKSKTRTPAFSHHRVLAALHYVFN